MVLTDSRSLFSRLPGGIPPTRAEIRGCATAGAFGAAHRDVPDPLGWADYAAVPALTHRVVLRRAHEERIPSDVSEFPLPKDWDGGLRRATMIEEPDDLVLRVLVGRCLPAVDARLHPRVVRGRLVEHPPGWRVEAWKVAHEARRELAEEWLANDATALFAAIDATEFFPRVLLNAVAGRLRSMHAPLGAVIAVVELLRRLEARGAPGGLPIGSESSVVLANVVLDAGDRVLERAGVQFVRFVDDTWLLPESEEHWEELRDAYARAVCPNGVTLHADKTRLMNSEEGRSAVVHGANDYATAGGSHNLDADETAEHLEAGIEARDGAMVRFALGALRTKRSPLGVPIIEDHPEVADLEAPRTGDYLIELSRTRKARRHLDADWLLERVRRIPTPGTVAGQVHAARILTELRPGNSYGRDCINFAERADVRQYPPLRAWAIAAGASVGRAREVIARARDLDTLTARRAALGGLRRHTISEKVERGLRDLVRDNPDLAPTSAWLASR